MKPLRSVSTTEKTRGGKSALKICSDFSQILVKRHPQLKHDEISKTDFGKNIFDETIRISAYRYSIVDVTDYMA